MPENFIEENIIAITAANIAILAAHIAGRTMHTQEGGEDAPMILGMWAGTLMQSRMAQAEAHARESARNN